MGMGVEQTFRAATMGYVMAPPLLGSTAEWTGKNFVK